MDVLDQWLHLHTRPHFTLARSAMVGAWGFRLEPGAALAFHLVRQGRAWLRRDGRPPVPLGPGDLVVLCDREAHDLADSPATPADPIARFGTRRFDLAGGAPSTVIFCGQFRPDPVRAQIGLAALPPFLCLRAADIAADPGIAGIVALLDAELAAPRQGNELLVERLADSLLVYVLRRAAELAGHQPGWLPAMQDPQLARTFRAIHAAPAEPWTVGAMAREAGLSRAAFARRFGARVGEAPMAYLTAWRMTLAARRLHAGRLPLRVVAAEVGYESEAAFSRAFKKYHGVAPAGYRDRVAARA